MRWLVVALAAAGCVPSTYTCRCDAAHDRPGAPHRWVFCEVTYEIPPRCIRCEDVIVGVEVPCEE